MPRYRANSLIDYCIFDANTFRFTRKTKNEYPITPFPFESTKKICDFVIPNVLRVSDKTPYKYKIVISSSGRHEIQIDTHMFQSSLRFLRYVDYVVDDKGDSVELPDLDGYNAYAGIMGRFDYFLFNPSFSLYQYCGLFPMKFGIILRGNKLVDTFFVMIFDGIAILFREFSKVSAVLCFCRILSDDMFYLDCQAVVWSCDPVITKANMLF